MKIPCELKFFSKRASAGYALQPVDPLFRFTPPSWRYALFPQGVRTVRTSPLETDPFLFRRFADCSFSPDSYLCFADRFGTLTGGCDALPLIASFHTVVLEALNIQPGVPRWLIASRSKHLSAHLRLAPGALRRRSGGKFANVLHVILRDGLRAKIEKPSAFSLLPMMVLKPRNLMVAIALQTARHLAGETKSVVQCLQCSEYFEVGPTTGRRSTSMFCSRKCQERHRYIIRKRSRD